jgi:hypothetical protein
MENSENINCFQMYNNLHCHISVKSDFVIYTLHHSDYIVNFDKKFDENYFAITHKKIMKLEFMLKKYTEFMELLDIFLFNIDLSNISKAEIFENCKLLTRELKDYTKRTPLEIFLLKYSTKVLLLNNT